MDFSQNRPQDKETLLVVDDNPADRKLMSIFLTEHGYHVLEAQDGEEGLEVFRNHMDKIDLILTDILMPGMDGVEFIQHVRSILPKVKVLFISAYKQNFKEEIQEEEAADFVEKSHDLSFLVLRVRQILDEKGPVRNWFSKLFSHHT